MGQNVFRVFAIKHLTDANGNRHAGSERVEIFDRLKTRGK
jgi:hypothetical protein